MTGQDGSYLTELLLAKSYEVHGIIRRASTFNTDRLDHLYRDPHDPSARLFLHYGDLADGTGLRRVLERVEPDEIYNLGAQSHVKVSFEQPEYTADVDALGTLRLLEALRDYQARTGRQVRLYQAGSSEMFGAAPPPQSEATPFHPRSPYAVSKLAAHWYAVNYREAYGLFVCNGILFNHECVTAETPVFIRRGGLIDLLPIEDVVPHRTDSRHGVRYTTETRGALEVWDANGWATVTCMTATWNGPFRRRPIKPVQHIAARGAVYRATHDHVVFLQSDGEPIERPAREVRVGDRLALIDLPQPTEVIEMTAGEAWLLGLLAAGGHVTPDGQVQVSNQEEALLDEAATCWRRVVGGASRPYTASSGFENGRDVLQLRLTGARAYGRYLREELYTRAGQKRIPRRVLNAPVAARLAFLRGFNAGDGLRGTPCTYEFQGFRTSSAVLAAGLYWMALSTVGQRAIVCVEDRDGRLYYQLNLNSPGVSGGKGQHLRRPLEEVVCAKEVEYEGWLFDLATSTGTFHAGVGQGWIHNSPRRGETFVSRKVTRAVGRIAVGLQETLYLGNLEARRDWGFAGDYVDATWRMLQADAPDDYVVATGESHSVGDLVEIAFGLAGLDWRKHVKIDPRYFRPTEVDHLRGDPAKARERLGWVPKVGFRQLIEMMVEADLELARQERTLRDAGHVVALRGTVVR